MLGEGRDLINKLFKGNNFIESLLKVLKYYFKGNNFIESIKILFKGNNFMEIILIFMFI